jgi:invasion protein IalB
MHKHLTRWIALSLAAGLGALAQTGPSGVAIVQPAAAASTVPTPAPRPTPDAKATPTSPAPNAPANAPKVTNKKTYGDWIYTCLNFPNAQVRCSIEQTLSSSETKKPVFQWRIAQDGKGGLVGIWQTPTGVLVNRGMVLDVGTPKPIVIPFEYCAPGGCEAIGNLAADFLATLAKTEKASATLYGRDGKPNNYLFSVKGLSAGLAALK